jgi:murein L,D-transpeptidase YafK
MERRSFAWQKRLRVRFVLRTSHSSCECPAVRAKIWLTILTLLAAAGVFLFLHHNRNRLPANAIADRIVVEKAERKLSLLHNGKVIKTYRVALGRNPVGAKVEEGDMKTPEGVYQVDNRNPNSDYHLALHISYPSEADNARAAARGVNAGFDIMIHGLPNGKSWIGPAHRKVDWTAGCIAVTDEEIEELWRAVPDGTTIEIRP